MNCLVYVPDKIGAYHSIASSSPSPFVADVLKIWNVLVRRASNPRLRCTSAKERQLGISCLFARTIRTAFFNSSSCNSVGILCTFSSLCLQWKHFKTNKYLRLGKQSDSQKRTIYNDDDENHLWVKIHAKMRVFWLE